MKLNPNLLKYANYVGLKMSNEYINKGDYYPTIAWGCEGQIYPSLMGLMLLELYKQEKKTIYIEAVKSIIAHNDRKQMDSGGWSLSLGAVANGSKFEVSEELIKITAEIEDLPSTSTALRLIAEYQIYTGDTTYKDSLKQGFDFLLIFWNSEQNIFNEMLSINALSLRANPLIYQIYSYQAIFSISKIYSEAEKYVMPLYISIKSIFESMNKDTYPLIYAFYAALIIETEKSSEYVKTIVKNRIIEDIAIKSTFRIPNRIGAYGHKDGLRGICLDEGHLRNSVGAVLAMKFYDIYVENDFFMLSNFYLDIENWILQMFNSENLFYEFIDFKTDIKLGVGTPGQFAPLMWILSKI